MATQRPRVLIIARGGAPACGAAAALVARGCEVVGCEGEQSGFALLRKGERADVVLVCVEAARLDAGRLVDAVRRHQGMERVPVLVGSAGKSCCATDELVAMAAAAAEDGVAT